MTFEIQPLLITSAGSSRYEYINGDSDCDYVVLWTGEDKYVNDLETGTDYFFTSITSLYGCWGHPLLLGNLTGDCTGDERLCTFLSANRREIAYAVPSNTALYGLEYISSGERYGKTPPIKAGLRTAMILSHMAAEAEDPFLLNDDEKDVLLRARSGGVLPEERADIYRRTISPGNINRLIKMPNHPTIKNDLFALIEEVSSC